MIRRSAWILVLLAVCPCVARAQGRLEQIRQDANQSDSSSSSNSSKNSSKGNHSSDDDDSVFAEIFGPMVLEGITLPFWLPYHLMDDDLSEYGYFPAYPYPDDYP